jgi:hypothetical protein
MVKKTIVIGVFIVSTLISLSGCFYNDSQWSQATKYLTAHSDMTEQEIEDFVWDRGVEQHQLLELAESKSYWVRAIAAKNENMPMDYLEKLMEDDSLTVVLASSYNPNFTAEMFDELTCRRDEDVRAYLTKNPHLPLNNLITLSKDKSNMVRAQAASNLRLPEEDLRRLAQDEFRFIRAGLAENRNIPLDILISLSKEDDPVVLSKVAVNAKLPETDIRRLFSRKLNAVTSRSIRRGLTKNPNTPVDILIEISKDKRSYISKAALQHPKMKQYRMAEGEKGL